MKSPQTKTCLLVYGALMALLAITVGVSFLRLGLLNVLSALGIAVAKMLLIGAFFMHLRYRNKLVWVFAVSGLFWLGILFVLAFSDFLTRGWPQ